MISWKEPDVRALAAKPELQTDRSPDFCNPTGEFQQSFIGSSFEDAYREAVLFLNHMFEMIERHEKGFDPNGKRILDFGCGWGRMLRLLRAKSDFDKTQLYGCDQHAKAVEICRQTIPAATICRTSAYPPCDFRSGLVDIVYAYSVFTHLSLNSHLLWAQEFYRLLKAGGYACITVQSRDFIIFCKELREGKREPKHPWHEGLMKAFKNDAECLRLYDSGEFVYDDVIKCEIMEDDVYADAVVPRAFIEKHWGRMGFKVVDWLEQSTPYRIQTRVLLQKI